MDNPETLATLGTKDTYPRQAHKNTTQIIKKRWATRAPSKTGVNAGCPCLCGYILYVYM